MDPEGDIFGHFGQFLRSGAFDVTAALNETNGRWVSRKQRQCSLSTAFAKDLFASQRVAKQNEHFINRSYTITSQSAAGRWLFNVGFFPF
jgi:hypothetical protein